MKGSRETKIAGRREDQLKTVVTAWCGSRWIDHNLLQLVFNELADISL